MSKKSLHKKFLNSLERLFYNWGKLVATNPWLVIGVTILATALCSLGFLQFRLQYRTDHLWIPSTSKYRENAEWKNENFKKNTRYQNVIFKSDNILTPDGIQQLFKLHRKMLKFNFNSSTFEDFCLKIPVQNFAYSGENRKYKREILQEPPLLKHNHGGDNRDILFSSGQFGRTFPKETIIPNYSAVEHTHDSDVVEDDLGSANNARGVSNKFKREISASATIVNGKNNDDDQKDGSGDHVDKESPPPSAAEKLDDGAHTIIEETGIPTSLPFEIDGSAIFDNSVIITSAPNVEEQIDNDGYDDSGDDDLGHDESYLNTGVNDDVYSDDSGDYDEKDYDIWDLYSQYDTTNDTKPPEDLAEAFAALSSDEYCELVSSIGMACFEQSLLELWSFDEEIIYNLTQQDIIDAVNLVDVSPWFYSPRNYTDDLGGITRNSSGHVVSAEAAWVHIITEIPEDAELVDPGGIGVGIEVADLRSLEFEKHLVMICNEANDLEGVQVRPASGSSFNDVSFEALFLDIYKVVIGYIIMFVYTVIMLGRMTSTEVRLYLSGMGMLSCIMGLASAMGITFLLGLEYNQTHNVLPFIAIGIGIDDMFVIMECWYNIVSEPSTTSLSLPEKLGRTLQHAGVSITVTSVTDVLAFALGSYTLLPGLQSFCVSAAICIAMIFLLQVSWFVAWLTLDQQRIEAQRHGIFLWKTAENVKEASEGTTEKVTEISKSKPIMEMYGQVLEKNRLLVFVVTFCFLGLGLYGSVNIEQRFDLKTMLPSDSYFAAWVDLQGSHFPLYGYFAWVMTGPLDWTDLARMEKMVKQLEDVAQPGPDRILSTIESWWPPFKTFLKKNKNMSWTDVRDDKSFHSLLSDFLFDVDNAKQQASFRFSISLQCGEPAPPIIATQQKLYYGMSSSNPPPSEYLPAKQTIDDIVDQSNVSSVAFVQAPIYQAWETDAIIGEELWRNLGMAMIAVGFVSLAFLGDFRLCLMVMVCVMLTLVNLVGTLHFWHVNIDVFSCVNVVLAIGLSVDYSVHIAHAFKSSKGSASSRTQAALTTLGPAVFNGGVTTLLAVIILPGSKSHILVTFFKVFGLTVLYGLFHGLVLLPVLLTTFGFCQESREDHFDECEVNTSKSISGIENESYKPDSNL